MTHDHDDATTAHTPDYRPLIVVGTLGACLLWAYWPTLRDMEQRWRADTRYSHGYLVPIFALALLWMRPGKPAPVTPRAAWGGALLVALGFLVRYAGVHYFFEWINAVSLLPTLAGLCVLAGGWPALRWAWPSIAFLGFMIPLPYRLEFAMGAPLQRVATLASTFTLQTLGFAAVAEGNTVVINESRLAVVDACNGLGMLFTFFAISTALALLIHRRWQDKVLIVLSAIPTALVANVARITLTGVLHETIGGRVADSVYHDWAGWLMMPLALAALGLELKLLDHLLIEPASALPSPLLVAPAAGDRPRRGGLPAGGSSPIRPATRP